VYKFCVLIKYKTFRKKSFFGSIDFLQTLKSNVDKGAKNLLYKCVLEFHLAFISRLEDSISSKKVQNFVLYCAYTCQLLSYLSASIPYIAVCDPDSLYTYLSAS
jgi:hypothetical protein